MMRDAPETRVISFPVRLPAPLDPYAEYVEFPDRWRAYLVAHFGTDVERVAEAFHVSRRAAGKWLTGQGGCKGGAVAIAVQLHPETAPKMLWAAE
ncbi:MAG: hypothetical protein CML02_02385 [Pseudooceanicola sp.]|nr:hypothetical protein [Pseudooceanicola sp.]